ncbi:MAG: tetratricopeptide repeat protein [Anaerolineales bacterium]|nr:tetratricopeptide repeat protein [Anaerolineales bacterium]
MTLSIQALGPLAIERNGQPVEGFTYNKVRGLLTYLALQSERPQPRAALCALLWPEQTEAAARQSLSQALTQLRKVLGPAAIKASVQTVELTLDVDVDVCRFLDLLAQCDHHGHRAWRTCAVCAERLEAAVDLYQGDFLSDFYISDSAAFEEWAQGWRERLRQSLLSALERLIERATWCGDLSAAVARARRRVALDPLEEAGQRLLLRVLARNGEHTAAEAQGESLRRLLEAELGVAPEPQTEALIDRIRAKGVDSGGPSPSAPTYVGPRPAQRLIGREAQLAALVRQLRSDDVRAVTLTGAPGIGKTRLAYAVAQSLTGDFEDGVFVVELAALTEPDLVPAAALQALGVSERPDRSARAALVDHLRRRQVLLVFDNFEHLLEAAAQVAEVLAVCPDVKVLATSRAPLHIRFEHHVPLAPLDADAAVLLFLERAQAASAAFGSEDVDPDLLADVVGRVDHLPLAIELVAVRVRALTLSDLRAQLDRRLPMLTGGARDLPARQRTLRDAIRWSHDRLAPDEQSFFAQLGVFSGGFTAEAAAAVCESGPATGAYLESLVANSLIQPGQVAGGTRYTLLETLHEYALEAVQAAGLHAAAQRRHAHFYANYAVTASPYFLGPQIGLWMDRVEAEFANLRAAVDWCRRHDVGLGLRLISAANRLWYSRGHMREVSQWFDTLLAAATDSTVAPEDLARGVYAAGVLAFRMNAVRLARERLLRSLALFQTLGERDRISSALSSLGNVLLGQGEAVEAERCYRDSLAILAELGLPWATASTTNNLGEALRHQARFPEAAACYIESITRYRELEDVSSCASSMTNLATVRIRLGQPVEAERLCLEALTMLESSGDHYRMADACLGLGNARTALGRPDLARADFITCIQQAVSAQDNLMPLYALLRLSEIEWAAARWSADRVAETLAMLATQLELGQVTLEPDQQVLVDRLTTTALAALGDTGYAAAWSRGQTRTLAEALTWLPG